MKRTQLNHLPNSPRRQPVDNSKTLRYRFRLRTMASALTPTGSTRAWRQLRQAWADRITQAGTWPCWRCHQPITPNMRWCLGHTTDRALGGTDDHLAPEHQHCSNSSGGRLGNTLRKARTTHRRTPSRSW